MASISSSRRSTAFAGIAALLVVVSLGLAGCGNDNPSDSGGTMSVDIRGLTQQMGGSGFSSMATGVDESPATTAVKSLVIGAVVITFTDTPLTSDTNVSDDLSDKLADDVINSINYFSIVDLPSTEAFIEFKVPPPGAGNWQVAVIGTRNTIATFEDIDGDSVGVYYGFSPRFYNTSSGEGETVDIEMKRACFIDSPPKGCASLGDDGDIVITSTVRILDILDNGNPMVGAVATALDANTDVDDDTDAANAMAAINAAFTPVSGHEYTVVVTHPDAPGLSGCASVTRVGYDLEDDAACIGTFVTTYE